MRAIDTGPLRRARELEHVGVLRMAIQENLARASKLPVLMVGA